MPISRRQFAASALVGLAGYLPDRLLALRPRPKLFIFLIAEQFRPVYLDRAFAQLATGGFRELMGNGIYYPNCNVSCSTFTSSGLATLATGAYPQAHGIVADRWYDRKMGVVARARGGILEATTLADEAARAGNTRIYCMGLNEEPTTVLAGHSDAQVFFMDNQGKFTTRGNAPDWLGNYGARSIESLHDARWAALGAASAAQPLRTLTFDANRPEDFFALYQSSYYSQDAQFDLLRALVSNEKLGQGDTLDLVFVSLGSIALLGYETGSDSALMEQMVLQLDRNIQELLDLLNRMPGKAPYNLIFAGAHGALADRDAWRSSRNPISSETTARAINKALSESFDKTPSKSIYVEKYIYPFLYLNLEALHKQNLVLPIARKIAGEAALRVPGVAGYYTADGDCSHTGEWRRRFENSFNELRCGDVMLSYDAEAVEDFGGGRGISYGSLYNYDTSVPLLLYGAQFGKKTIERSIEAVDLAPTVARAALLSLPSSAIGQVLAEAFAEAPEERPK